MILKEGREITTKIEEILRIVDSYEGFIEKSVGDAGTGKSRLVEEFKAGLDFKEIHECIGLVMDDFFPERLSEFCEALASHFKRGHSHNKAVDYLVRSGEKSLGRHAVQETHQYFKNAFEIGDNPLPVGPIRALGCCTGLKGERPKRRCPSRRP